MSRNTFDLVCAALAVGCLVALMVFEALRRWKLRQAPYRTALECTPAQIDWLGSFEQTLTLECGHQIHIRVGRPDQFKCDQCRDAALKGGKA